MELQTQIIWLFLLSIPVACVAWTFTHEEVFREPREFCAGRCRDGKTLAERKFFYLFTCEYCFSHYISAFFIFLTNYRLLLISWKGIFLAWFALVFVANIYMSLFALLRQAIKKEKVAIEKIQKDVSKDEVKTG